MRLQDITEVTQELLKQLFVYSNGHLLHKEKGRKVLAGASLGTPSYGAKGSRDEKRVYLKCSLGKKMYYVHRLIWLYHYGVFPTRLLDHEDHDTLNNRIGNLVEVDFLANGRNQKRISTNTSGFTGVVATRKEGHFAAQIHIEGKHVHLGTFTSLELAVAARKEANVAYGFHVNHGMPETPTTESIL